MRDIKFRAWNIRRKKMHNVSDIKWLPYGVIKIDVAAENGYDPLLYMPNYEGEELKEYELMQYTQLQDKNEKEIYEGDIVKFTERNYEDCSREELISEETSIQIVIYEHLTFGLRKNLNDTSIRPFLWLMGFDYDIEVIGNIYENPVLLETEEPLEMDCLVCDIGEENKCAGCCRD